MRSVLLLSFVLSLATGQDVNWGKKVKCFVVQGEVICPGCNQRAGLSCPRRRKDGLDFESCIPPTRTYLPPTKTNFQPTRPYFPPTRTHFTPNRTYFPPARTYLPPTSKYDSMAPMAKTASTVDEIPASEGTTELFHSKSTHVEMLHSSEPSLSDGQILSKEEQTWKMPELRTSIPDVDVNTISNEIEPLQGSTQKEPHQYEVTQDSIDWDLVLYLYRVLGPNQLRRQPRSTRDIINEDDDLETCNWNGDCPCPLVCCNRGEGCPRKCMSGIRLPPPWG